MPAATTAWRVLHCSRSRPGIINNRVLSAVVKCSSGISSFRVTMLCTPRYTRTVSTLLNDGPDEKSPGLAWSAESYITSSYTLHRGGNRYVFAQQVHRGIK